MHMGCSLLMSNNAKDGEINMSKKIFKNGYVIVPSGSVKGSLVVENGKIVGILTSGMRLPGYDGIDVHGKYLMPGLIDTHVHMWDPSPLNYREDWEHGSQCAASGGITTIVDMPLSVCILGRSDTRLH